MSWAIQSRTFISPTSYLIYNIKKFMRTYIYHITCYLVKKQIKKSRPKGRDLKIFFTKLAW
jgi:hypothetical protein